MVLVMTFRRTGKAIPWLMMTYSTDAQSVTIHTSISLVCRACACVNLNCNMMPSWHGNIYRATYCRWLIDCRHKVSVTRSLEIFVDVRLNKWLNKHLSCVWFEIPWRQCSVTVRIPWTSWLSNFEHYIIGTYGVKGAGTSFTNMG